MKYRIEVIGKTKKENTIHILTSEESVNLLMTSMAKGIENAIGKLIDKFFGSMGRSIFLGAFRDKWEKVKKKLKYIHTLRRIDFEFFNYNFVVELIKESKKRGKNGTKQ